jgi:hypothetical protein
VKPGLYAIRSFLIVEEQGARHDTGALVYITSAEKSEDYFCTKLSLIAPNGMFQTAIVNNKRIETLFRKVKEEE